LSDIFLISDSVRQLFAGRHHYDSAPFHWSAARDVGLAVSQQMLVTPTTSWQDENVSVFCHKRENSKCKMLS